MNIIILIIISIIIIIIIVISEKCRDCIRQKYIIYQYKLPSDSIVAHSL